MNGNHKKPVDDSFRLAREIEAAKILRASLSDLTDDEDAIRDTLEGELSLRELITKVVAEIGEKNSEIDGLNKYIEKLDLRKVRIGNSIEFKRTLICNAMEQAGLDRLSTDIGTVTVKAVPPAVVITDEAQIPAQFWKSKDPTLDKSALKQALKDKQIIAGAELGNGGRTIQIRS